MRKYQFFTLAHLRLRFIFMFGTVMVEAAVFGVLWMWMCPYARVRRAPSYGISDECWHKARKRDEDADEERR